VECRVVGAAGDGLKYCCAVCGRYVVAGTVASTTLDPEREVLTEIQRAELSARVREANEEGTEPLITSATIDSIRMVDRLSSPAIVALRILRWIGDKVAVSGRAVRELPVYYHAAVGAPNRNFAMRFTRELESRGLLSTVECGDNDSPYEVMEVDLTLAGWEAYEKERQGQLSGTYGFIALKFGDSVLDPFLQNVIKPAVASIGYVLQDLRDTAEAGVIDNVMRARIRDAAFVLVDLTHANEGAYWEAGYAEGLGKPVLYLCERAVFDAKGTHFDTNHCTTVMWEAGNPSAFTAQLVATLRRSLGLLSR
jgi:hypothetical protein